MAKGRVNIRTNHSTGKARLRFYDVYPEQVETVLAALEKARQITGSYSDTVGLEAICMDFLAGPLTPIQEVVNKKIKAVET